MKIRYFDIDGRGGILLCYDFGRKDYPEIWSVMRSFGLGDDKAEAAMGVLSKEDTGMTLTSFKDKMSVLFISGSSSDEEWFDTLIHELRHVVDHISEYYDVGSMGEPPAYLQGEIGRQFFPIIIDRFCPTS